MKTTDSTSTNRLSKTTLLADYSRWLDFAMVSRQTIRQYDRHLIQIGRQFPALSALSNYLRTCMHGRSQFFGSLASQLTRKVTRLRTEPANEALIRQLTHAHPAMQSLITQLTEALADIDESYQMLFPSQHRPTPGPQTPAPNRQTYRA